VQVDGGAVRLLVVLVVTTALLMAAVPLAVTQAPRLHSPSLAAVAFGTSLIALVAGVVLLARSAVLGRRARRDAEQADALTDPRPGRNHVVLVPTAGRVLVAASGPASGPRHALVDDLAVARRIPRQSRHSPSTAGQSPSGESHTHAQASSAVAEASDARAAAFAARYTSTRSRR
jgi:hypothetical protein